MTKSLSGLLLVGMFGTPLLANGRNIDLIKADAKFVYAHGNLAIWQTSELIESTRSYRAQSFIHRFYRQRIGQTTATLIHTTQDTRVRFTCALMPDGTTVLHHRAGLSWIGNGVKHHAAYIYVTRLWPDGALAQLSPDGKTYFIPFAGQSLDVQSKIEISENACRHESQFAWIADSKLHLYSLKSKRRTTLPLEAKLHPSNKVTAFDGETVMASVHVFDARTGRLIGERKYPKMPTRFAYVFAVRNRIGYYCDKDKLFATALEDPKKQPVLIMTTGSSLAQFHDKRGIARPAHFQDKRGIHIWNGGKWVLVKWFEDYEESELKNAEKRDAADET